METIAIRRGRPTAEDSRQKIEGVLAVAREMFADMGYRSVTMREVAERAQVSTRTLYNRFADKMRLFEACLDSGATVFPRLEAGPNDDLELRLGRHAAAIVRALSSDTSLRLGMMVYREGGEFPELLRAAEENQDRYLVQPLAVFLRNAGLERPASDERAKLFIAMAISNWQRAVTFRHRMPADADIDRHATEVADVFLNGVQ